jgi:hypothetical protein
MRSTTSSRYCHVTTVFWFQKTKSILTASKMRFNHDGLAPLLCPVLLALELVQLF